MNTVTGFENLDQTAEKLTIVLRWQASKFYSQKLFDININLERKERILQTF